jgi:hypothetical protein
MSRVGIITTWNGTMRVARIPMKATRDPGKRSRANA